MVSHAVRLKRLMGPCIQSCRVLKLLPFLLAGILVQAQSTSSLQNGRHALGDPWPIISEFVIDHTGTDTHEFIEIFGEPMTNYSNVSLLVIDGLGNPGLILRVYAAGDTGSAGFWDTGFLNDQLANNDITLMCVYGFSSTVGTDLDTDDNGQFDLQPWSQISDDVSIGSGNSQARAYSSVVLQMGGGQKRGMTLGGASRHPYGFDTDTPNDWIFNDFDGAGLPNFPGSLVNGEAKNTPGMITNLTLDDYYADVDPSSESVLRMTLHDAISNHARYPYTSSFTDSWDVLNMADQDPNDPTKILAIYTNATYTKQSGGNSNYNREHTWPRSFGFPDNNDNNAPFTDFHALRLSNISANSNRSSIAFGTCSGGCNEQPTQVNNGQGGGMGVYPGNSNWYSGSAGSGNYEVWHFRRGDIARSLLYLDVRYEGDVHEIRQYTEPDLILTDQTSLIQTSGGVNTAGNAYMGRLSVLLQWHADDPVDDIERRRNDIIYAHQGNRNPFVDHPEWVDCIFSGDCPQTCVSMIFGAWLNQPSTCSSGLWDVLDLVEVVNGTCGCN